jgi:hypothetical protein
MGEIGQAPTKRSRVSIAFEVDRALAVTHAPPLQDPFDIASAPPHLRLGLGGFPFVVGWAVDEAHPQLVHNRPIAAADSAGEERS